jgi:hypothetical protein
MRPIAWLGLMLAALAQADTVTCSHAPREARNLAVNGAALIALWGACAAFVYGPHMGIGWIAGPPRPDAPGEMCERDYDGFTGAPAGGQCCPLPGWHVESWPLDRRYDVYVHDNASDAQWRIDVATSMLWPFVSRRQQKEILDGKATIEKFRTTDEIDKVTIDGSM